jgi:CheY-like chemotaxis protein
MEERIEGLSELPVLVIDDVSPARAVLCDMLYELGFQTCIEARDAAEALDVLRTTRVQLILSDVVMDGMTGIELLTYMKRKRMPDLPPIIFVSALGDVSSVESAMGLGASDYVVKPVSFRKLRRKIENALGMSKSPEKTPCEVPA